MNAKNRLEFELWQELCGQLLESGAVSPSDMRAPVGAGNTQGQRLFNAIRQWGEARFAMGLLSVDRKAIVPASLTDNGDGQFEVHPCHETGHFNAENKAIVEVCDDPENCGARPHFWSVYEHQQHGGVECIADCSTRNGAETLASILEAACAK